MTDFNQTQDDHLERVRLAAVFLLCFGVALWLQWQSGAFHQTLCSQSDEPAHFVTGVMIRDYVASGFPDTPLSYARSYYEHYPKVGFGAWPPVFHALEGAWMLVFGPTRGSALILMVFLTACLASLVFVEARREFGRRWAAGAALFITASPLTQQTTVRLLPDTLTAIALFLTAIMIRRYLEQPGMKTAAYTGAAGGMALATKANAFSLFLMLPLVIVFSRRLDLFHKRSFWVGSAIALAIGIPAELFPLLLAHGRGDSLGSVSETALSFAVYLQYLIGDIGIGPVLLALAGLALVVVRPALSGGALPVWSATGSLAVGILVFHALLSAGPERSRYLLPALPAIVLLGMAGATEIGKLFPSPAKARLTANLLCILALVSAAARFDIVQKQSLEVTPMVTEILRSSGNRGEAVLVASDEYGEGAVVSEFVRLEQRPNHYVLRGSKTLGRSDWNGTFFKPLYENADELMAYMRGVPIRTIIIDQRPGALPPELARDLKDNLRQYADEFALMKRHRETGFAVYRLQAGEAGLLRSDGYVQQP